MSDLTLIAENIRTAMEAMERTQALGENLQERVTRENYVRFRSQMNELYQRLHGLNAMLLHEDEMALDELADALNHTFNKPSSEYRHSDGHG
jgi:uncharacterized protein YukE